VVRVESWYIAASIRQRKDQKEKKGKDKKEVQALLHVKLTDKGGGGRKKELAARIIGKRSENESEEKKKRRGGQAKSASCPKQVEKEESAARVVRLRSEICT